MWSSAQSAYDIRQFRADARRLLPGEQQDDLNNVLRIRHGRLPVWVHAAPGIGEADRWADCPTVPICVAEPFEFFGCVC